MPAVVLVACVDGDSILVLAGIGLLGLAQELIDNVPVSGEQAYLETLTGASFAKILPCPRDTHPVIVIDQRSMSNGKPNVKYRGSLYVGR